MAVREDTRRNRELILLVADQAFSADEHHISLEKIAKRAGLSGATAYRRLPNRRSLAAAVTARWTAMLQHVVSAEPALEFHDVLRAVMSAQATMRPLEKNMDSCSDAQRQKSAKALLAALTPAFERARENGSPREDLRPEDLLLLTMFSAGLGHCRPGTDAAARSNGSSTCCFTASSPSPQRTPF
ncbi:TetR/AcrR family transcriptional regulator [Spirillospora sp. NPDC127200]